MSAERIVELQAMLSARTGRDGAKPGYKRNVDHLRAEIARLTQEQSRGQPR